MSLLLGGGGFARDKNTSARVCAKNVGGAYARGGAYLWDTTVFYLFHTQQHMKLLVIHSNSVYMGKLPIAR